MKRYEAIWRDMDQWERVIPHFFLTRDNKVCGQPGHVQASNLNWKLLPCLLTLYFTIFCVMLTESGWLSWELCIGINGPWCSHIKTVILLFNNKTSWYCVYFVVSCPSVCVIRTPWLHNIMPYSTKIMMKKQPSVSEQAGVRKNVSQIIKMRAMVSKMSNELP